MPELPEVEITRRLLEPNLLGRTIEAVVTTQNSYFFLTPPQILKKKLPGRKVVALRRTGKYLLADLDDRSALLLHLGMTGQLFTRKSNARRAKQPDAHTHLRISFADLGPEVCFRDVRKFGKVKLVPQNQREPRLARLGDDALVLTGQKLFATTRKRNAAIKTLLLNQSIIAGVGNIYADEALFIAGLCPTRHASKLSLDDCERLIQAIRRVLGAAITAGGSTIRDFVAPDGRSGHYQAQRLVYARTGLACSRCKQAIVRIVLGGRGTHYCKSCQS